MNHEAQAEQLIAQLGALENSEPECECSQSGPDTYDNRSCEVCNPQSAWNRNIKMLEAQLEDARAMIAYQASGEWAWPEPWEEVA